VLQIVGSEHDDDEVERHVRFQRYRQGAQTILVAALDRIVANAGAARMAFLDDLKAAAELTVHHARPTSLPGITAAGAARGARNGAVSVGIAETKNGANLRHAGFLSLAFRSLDGNSTRI
jgi:hypothetical protein